MPFSTSGVYKFIGTNVQGSTNGFGALTTGNRNVAIGTDVLNLITTGFGNIAIGDTVMRNTVTGAINNVGIGDNVLTSLTTGDYNVIIGNQAMENLTTGIHNIGLGRKISAFVETGSHNIALGFGSGPSIIVSSIATSNTISIGQGAGFDFVADFGICIGYNTFTNGFINVMALGANAQTGADNVIVIGDPGDATLFTGLGISAPTEKLHVNGAVLAVGGLKISLATAIITSTVALTDGAGAAVGTLNNAPAAGNPTKWIQIDDNGTIRKIPAW